MTLETYFQLSVSIFCTLATLFLMLLIIWAFILRNQIKKLIIKLEAVAEVAKATVAEAKDYTEKTIERIERFKENIVTLDFIRKVVGEVLSHLKKSKGDKNG